jgi:hypothetical protein
MLWDAIYAHDDEQFRVVVLNGVVAVPYDGWSGDGYGSSISLEWMHHEGVLSKLPKARRQVVAELVRRGLADAHGYTVKDCRPFVIREIRASSRAE